MPADKIDVARLAHEAAEYANNHWTHAHRWQVLRDEHFAHLVMEECAKVCDITPPSPFRPSIEAAHAIRSMKP